MPSWRDIIIVGGALGFVIITIIIGNNVTINFLEI